MTRSIAMLAVTLIAMCSRGQTVSPPAAVSHTSAQVPSQTMPVPVSTVLLKDVDTRHAKVGDLVRARVYSGLSGPGGTHVPPGSIASGRITEVSKLGKGSIESHLAVVFDQIQTPDGQTVPVHMGIAGLAAAPPIAGLENLQEMSSDLESPFPGARSTGTTVDPGGQRSTANTIGGTDGTRVTRTLPGRQSAQTGVTNDVGAMRPSDHIASAASVGSTVEGITLKPSPAEYSILVSTSNSISLRTGTSLVLLPIPELKQ